MRELIAAGKGKRVVVFGDLIADEYVYGRIARVSREAPVLILEYNATEILPGGAGNAANNVASLGGIVRLVSLVGRDEAGRRLFKVLPRSVERAGLSRPGGYRTPVKTRILAGGIHSAKQQVVRIDRYSSEPVSDAQRKVAERAALKAIRQADAVLVSDYGSGLVTPRFVAELASRLRRRGVPILIDSRYALTKYRGLTACTPNESEVEQVLGVTIDDQTAVLERAGRTLLERTAHGLRADHARQPRHGALRAGQEDRPHPDFRIGSDCRRHRRRRYGDGDDDAGAGGRAGRLKKRPGWRTMRAASW